MKTKLPSWKRIRGIYGKSHPYSLLYRCIVCPYMIPYVILCLPFHICRFLLTNLIKNGRTKRLLKRNRKLMDQRFNDELKGREEEIVGDIIKPLALYLPQYHQIPENDKWWGEGFTEWTNVKKAVPMYEGHYQPHIPHRDVGYYDLSDVDVMRKQVDMAKKYGIYGFCFYYYFFANGKRLLEKPINNWLEATDIDFPFCFSWANENWTRAWDGGDKEILMPQDYHEDNMLQMIREMLPAFRDKRYIKLGNKPVLFVYRAELVPEIQNLASKWKALVRENGFDDLILISMQNFVRKNPYEMGFDAASEFAPRAVVFKAPFSFKDYILHSELNVHGYMMMDSVMDNVQNMGNLPYPCIKCVTPSWDNSPRRGKRGANIIFDASPDMFRKFMALKVRETVGEGSQMDGLFLINAWNEWGEGAHLEPDEKYGYQYLEVVREVCSSTLSDIAKM